MSTAFPFSALVGQDEMKLALLAAAVDPRIGGVLVFGDRGTGKSTAVRALASLLPKMRVVTGCRYGCDPDDGDTGCPDCAALRARGRGALRSELVPVPVVDLPLGATEDRVVGALDLERALSQGVKAFEPGLLARAHRGFLYIDEVNLLEDHLVDLLIDVAASGENVVEREGLSVRHAARFVLVGSGNPEEGELRPQLLDRFGLSVEVKTPDDLATRVEVVRRRDDFERDREGFAQRWKKEDERTRKRIVAARNRLDAVTVGEPARERAAQLCHALGRDVVLAGDAAGVVAPASGEGIYYAMLGGQLAAQAVLQALRSGDARSLALARKRFMKDHGTVFRVLGIMQWFWYSSDRRRERFVKICEDRDVQQITFDSYMNKRLERRKPMAHVRIFFKDMAHLLGLARV